MTHRSCSAVATSAVNRHSFTSLKSLVADLEKPLDLVEGRCLEVLDGDDVDGEPFDRGGRRRHLGREADEVRNLVQVFTNLQVYGFPKSIGGPAWY